MNKSLLQLPNSKYIHIVYISIIASLLLGATVGPSILRAAAQDDDARVLGVLCNSYGEGVDVNREGRSERISFAEWLADQRPGLVDLFNEVGCAGISAAVAGGEFFGSGTIVSTTVRTAEPLSACVDLVTRTGTRVWTGIVDGTTSNTLLKAVTDNCDMHGQGRLIYMFTDVTIKPDQSDPSTWITGGAVVEGIIDFTLTAPVPAGGVFKSESEHRFLCGTGDLEGIHGVGVSSASASLTAVSLDYVMWVHFDDHETGFEFLCAGLG